MSSNFLAVYFTDNGAAWFTATQSLAEAQSEHDHASPGSNVIVLSHVLAEVREGVPSDVHVLDVIRSLNKLDGLSPCRDEPAGDLTFSEYLLAKVFKAGVQYAKAHPDFRFEVG